MSGLAGGLPTAGLAHHQKLKRTPEAWALNFTRAALPDSQAILGIILPHASEGGSRERCLITPPLIRSPACLP